MGAKRGSWWTRWPEPDDGPLWAGIHLNERGGEIVVVGLEVWTEAPGRARSTLGPPGDDTDDLLPFPATALTAADLAGLHLDRLVAALRDALRRSDHDVVRQAADILAEPRRGRPRLYAPDHFARVAAVHQVATQQGSRSPTLDVARRWGVSRSAAAKWVARARAAGHLPPA